MDVSPFRLAEQLLTMDASRSRPSDLPGRYGRVVADLDRLCRATKTRVSLVGGWAVWRHGYAGRVTEDIDVVVAADTIDELRRNAAHFGFADLAPPEGRWPKLSHLDTGIEVDLLPQDGRPGRPGRLAPTTIDHPESYREPDDDAVTYGHLPGLIELKLAAGRLKDQADVVALIEANPESLQTIRDHLQGVHPDYPPRFERLVDEAESDVR